MKKIEQTIVINKPIEEVFNFTINPENTPKWVESIASEQTDEWPVKIGTIYRSQNQFGESAELELIAFEPNRTFAMRMSDGSEVRYTFSVQNTNKTSLDYIWASDGRLDAFFLDKILKKLKSVIENT
jgi:uncharacterized protein YndB with AHSA1/START domain